MNTLETSAWVACIGLIGLQNHPIVTDSFLSWINPLFVIGFLIAYRVLHTTIGGFDFVCTNKEDDEIEEEPDEDVGEVDNSDFFNMLGERTATSVTNVEPIENVEVPEIKKEEEIKICKYKSMVEPIDYDNV